LPSSQPDRETPIGHVTHKGRQYLLSMDERTLQQLVKLVDGGPFNAATAASASVITKVRLTKVET
jgi:hypothetical protein